MGTFRIDYEIENPITGERRQVRGALVETGSELSWVPTESLASLGIRRQRSVAFRQANGSVVERWVGFAIMQVAGTMTSDDVVFGEAQDLVILGARSLEGLNLRVDPAGKQLVDAGPAPAAVAA